MAFEPRIAGATGSTQRLGGSCATLPGAESRFVLRRRKYLLRRAGSTMAAGVTTKRRDVNRIHNTPVYRQIRIVSPLSVAISDTCFSSKREVHPPEEVLEAGNVG
jgi:hypothetical protein